ncbi:MAG TPA: histidine phosphatase family protein, partial [Acidimicrobiia bacterium]
SRVSRLAASEQMVMASEVVLIRHGATEWSANGRHTGRTDIPLIDEGRAAARALAPRVAAFDFALVLVSPLQRARETCDLVGLGAGAVIDDDLREWDYGDYEGVTTKEVRETDPGWTVFTGAVPNGETPEQVATRADRVIARADGVDGTVALVAHGHILRVLGARWCSLAPTDGARLCLDTSTLCVLGYERETKCVRSWNC